MTHTAILNLMKKDLFSVNAMGHEISVTRTATK